MKGRVAEQLAGPTIYTIGHSNAAADAVVALLHAFEIEILVDVRSAPYSQYTPQFNREPFAQMLSQAGIEYRFAGVYLGGRPNDPTCYKNRELPDNKANYLELVDYPEVAKRPWFQKGIARLIAIGGERRTTVLCSEENPNHCHRHHLIAPALMRLGVTVAHIRSQGSLEIARPQAEQMSLLDME